MPFLSHLQSQGVSHIHSSNHKKLSLSFPPFFPTKLLKVLQQPVNIPTQDRDISLTLPWGLVCRGIWVANAAK